MIVFPTLFTSLVKKAFFIVGYSIIMSAISSKFVLVAVGILSLYSPGKSNFTALSNLSFEIAII